MRCVSLGAVAHDEGLTHWVPGVEARAGKFPGPSLIPELNAIQARLGWLPREELVALARQLHRPLYEIEGLVSFYPHFRTEEPPPVALHAVRMRMTTMSSAAPTARFLGLNMCDTSG